KDCNVPRAEPSWDSAATLESPANWRSAWGSLVAPKSTAMVPFQAPVAAVGVSVSVGGGLKAGGVAAESQFSVAVPTVTSGPPPVSGMVAVTVQVSAAVLV